MFSLKTLLFSHKTAAPADEQPKHPQGTIVRKNFTWDIEDWSVEYFIDTLRQFTVDESMNEGTIWHIVDFDFHGVEVRCKLTEAQDIVFAVNGETVFHPRAAMNMVQTALQF